MRRPLSDLLPNIEHPSSGPVDVREDHLGRASYRSVRSVNITDRVATIGMDEFSSPSGPKPTLQGGRRSALHLKPDITGTGGRSPFIVCGVREGRGVVLRAGRYHPKALEAPRYLTLSKGRLATPSEEGKNFDLGPTIFLTMLHQVSIVCAIAFVSLSASEHRVSECSGTCTCLQSQPPARLGGLLSNFLVGPFESSSSCGGSCAIKYCWRTSRLHRLARHASRLNR